MRQTFETALEELQQTDALLPPIGQPHGNVRAYEKFLGLYQQLTGHDPQSAGKSINVTLEIDLLA